MSEPEPQTETRGAGGAKPPRPPAVCADAGEPGRRKYEIFRRALEAYRRRSDSGRKA